MSQSRKADAAEQKAEEKKSCFVMMPISDVDGYPQGHFGEVYSELIEPAVSAAGYNCTLATSTSSAHLIQLDVVTKVVTADLCICDLSTNNPNVLFEYGIRQAFDKPTVLLKDDNTRRIFDLNGFRDIEYDHTLRIANVMRAREDIIGAIKDTVNGSGDGSQVFSLVHLMKLASAAKLPTENIKPEDARLKLLERKIDVLLTNFADLSSDSPAITSRNYLNRRKIEYYPDSQNSKQNSNLPRLKLRDGLTLVFAPSGILVVSPETGNTSLMITNYGDLQKQYFWKLLDDEQQQEIIALAEKESPNFIPF